MISEEKTIIEFRHPLYNSAVILKLNRPKVKNAMRPKDIHLLRDSLHRLQIDPETHIIIITGTEDAFTSGADINSLNELTGIEMNAFIDAQVDMLSQIILSPKIIIAAINGVTAGLGNHLVTCCDLAIAHEDAVFHFTGASKAIPSLLMGTLLLPMTIGLKRAKAIYLRGGKIDAQQAFDYGLCNQIVSNKNWDTEIDNIAAEFNERNSSTMSHNKFQLNQGAYQMLGALKLSGLAGAVTLSQRTNISTGKVL